MKKSFVFIIIVAIIILSAGGYYYFSNQENYTYVIDDMSAEDIVDECMYYLENDTHSGQTPDDFFAFYKPAVESFVTDDNKRYVMNYFKKDVAPECDVVKTISVTYPITDLDGTINLNARRHGNYSYVQLIVYDYDKATEIYRLFLEPLSNNFEDVNETRESSWVARGDIKGSDNNVIVSGNEQTKFLSVEREDDYYVIEAYDYLGSRADMFRYGNQ